LKEEMNDDEPKNEDNPSKEEEIDQKVVNSSLKKWSIQQRFPLMQPLKQVSKSPTAISIILTTDHDNPTKNPSIPTKIRH